MWSKLLIAVVVLISLAGGTLYFTAPRDAVGACYPTQAQTSPPCVPLPAGVTLVKMEQLITEHIQNWYYRAPQTSLDDITAFYQTAAQRNHWTCYAAMSTTNIMQHGQTIAGAGVYIQAAQGTTKIQINSGSLLYGEQLLSDHLDDGDVSLKISLEPLEDSACA